MKLDKLISKCKDMGLSYAQVAECSGVNYQTLNSIKKTGRAMNDNSERLRAFYDYAVVEKKNPFFFQEWYEEKLKDKDAE